MPSDAEWFVDANTTGLGHVLATAHLPVTWIGDDGIQRRRKKRHHLNPCPVTNHGEDDDVWIPKVVNKGMSILTRDEHIATRLAEHEAVRTAGGQLFAITSAGDLDLWELTQIVARQWSGLVERRNSRPGPIIWGFTMTTFSIVREW